MQAIRLQAYLITSSRLCFIISQMPLSLIIRLPVLCIKNVCQFSIQYNGEVFVNIYYLIFSALNFVLNSKVNCLHGSNCTVQSVFWSIFFLFMCRESWDMQIFFLEGNNWHVKTCTGI